jgi:LysR family hydrogen peroxide-inducible transcriptional activator
LTRRLAAAYPQLRLYIREEQTAPLLEKLAGGDIDLVLLALPYDVAEFETATIGDDAILAALPKDHPLATKPALAPGDLRAASLLMLEDGHCLRTHALEACRLAGRAENEVFQGTSLRTLVAMAAAGLGATLLPAMAAEAELPDDGSLALRPLSSAAAHREIALAWRRSSARKSEFRLLGEHAAAVLQEMAAESSTPRASHPGSSLPRAGEGRPKARRRKQPDAG